MNTNRVVAEVAESTYRRGVVQLLTLIITGLGFPMTLGFIGWLAYSIAAVNDDINAVKVDTVEIKGSVAKLEERVGGIQALSTLRNSEQDRRIENVERLGEYLRSGNDVR